MADIVNVGFRVNTNEIEKGYKRLDRMGKQAQETESKVTKMSKGIKAAGANIAMFGTAATAAGAAVAAFVYQLGVMEREIQASARMAGLTTDQFEAMGFAYKQFGLTVEQVNDIYKDSRERVGEWLNSQSGALQTFGDAMGMSKDEITAFAKEVNHLTGQELLQRMVNDLEAAGIQGNQLSSAIEDMASEATRMIPALENNGKAVNALSQEYLKFNAAFSLNDEEVQTYADLTKNFDLFLDTAQNGVTKVLAPLAKVLSIMAIEAAEFLSSINSGSVAAAQDKYSEALAEQLKAREMLGKAQAIPDAFGDDVVKQEIAIAQARLDAANDAVAAADKQLEAAKKNVDAALQVKRSTEMTVNLNVGGLSGKGTATPANTGQDFGQQFGGVDHALESYYQWIDSIQTATTKMTDLRMEVERTRSAMEAGDLNQFVGEEHIANLEAQMKALEVNPFESMTQGAQDAMQAMSGMFESGSKDAQKLAIAMQALNLVQAIGAVLNQGSGDPYTAFGRMAAMAGMVASLGMSVGNISGGLEDASADNQANQGLNQWGEKSESIVDATEMTASATEKLVGINTDMLKALQGLSQSMFAASGIAAKNINIPDANVKVRENLFEGMEGLFSGDILNLTGILGETFTDLLNAPIRWLGSWLGGSSKVRDEGIRIIGGSLANLMEDVSIQAFQQVEYKKWRFGSKKKKTKFQEVGDDVGKQFALVFESIADSVAVGAQALGLSQTEIEDAINAFNVATTTLSLKGMSATQRQEAINNYFSSVFNNLAGSVVPFLDEFQQVGEELGETLSRVATQVSVAEYMVENFGLTFGDKMADPKAFAEAADNLATLAGGVEALAEQTSQFTNAFATDSQKFDIYKKAMQDALGAVGLTIPATAEGMFELMSSLDGTTEAGQEQIATLLGLTDTAKAYFKLLDDTAGAYRRAAESMFEVTEASRKMSLESALAAAKLGDFSLAEQLDLNSIAPSTGDFNSMLEFNLARAETAAKLNQLADLQAGQVSVEDKQLTVLEQIRDKLGDGGTMGNKEIANELLQLRAQNNKQQTETNDYLRRMAYREA